MVIARGLDASKPASDSSLDSLAAIQHSWTAVRLSLDCSLR